MLLSVLRNHLSLPWLPSPGRKRLRDRKRQRQRGERRSRVTVPALRLSRQPVWEMGRGPPPKRAPFQAIPARLPNYSCCFQTALHATAKSRLPRGKWPRFPSKRAIPSTVRRRRHTAWKIALPQSTGQMMWSGLFGPTYCPHPPQSPSEEGTRPQDPNTCPSCVQPPCIPLMKAQALEPKCKGSKPGSSFVQSTAGPLTSLGPRVPLPPRAATVLKKNMEGVLSQCQAF